MATHLNTYTQQGAQAELRGRALIKLIFGQEALDCYLRNGYVVVKTRKIQYKVYNIEVRSMDSHQGWCVQPVNYTLYCQADNVLTLALHLKANPKQFFKTANMFSGNLIYPSDILTIFRDTFSSLKTLFNNWREGR